MVQQRFIFGFFLISAIIFSCTSGEKYARIPETATIIQPHYSKLFQMGIGKSDTFLVLTDPADSENLIGAYCWGHGTVTPAGFKRIAKRNRLAVLSAVFVGIVESLGAESRIVAVDNAGFISSPKTSRRIAEGKISSVSGNGSADREKIAMVNPDIILAYYIDQKGRESLDPLNTENTRVIYIQNFLESHPLGRAEWLLVIGALTGKLQTAQAQFGEIEEHYLSTMARVPERRGPEVLVNAPFSGVWDVPAGDSYMAQLIADAGGEYIFEGNRGTGRIPMDIEKVFLAGQHADIWINPGACRDTQCLKMLDARVNLFESYKSGNIYNCTKLLKPNGANPWWDYAPMRPDLVLLDLFAMMHPEIEFSHEPVFFERIGGK